MPSRRFRRCHDLPLFYAFAPVYGFGYSEVMTGLLVTVRALTPAARRAESMGGIFAFAWRGRAAGGFQGGYFFGLTATPRASGTPRWPAA